VGSMKLETIQSCVTFFFISGVGLSPLGTAATSGLLYKPQMIDEGDCGAIGGMKIGRGNPSTRRKPAPVPLCPPQISHDHHAPIFLYLFLDKPYITKGTF
jgi:hypothetical protein